MFIMFKNKTTKEIEEATKIRVSINLKKQFNKILAKQKKYYNKRMAKQKETAENLRQSEERLYNDKLREQRNIHEVSMIKMNEDLDLLYANRIEKIEKEHAEILKNAYIELNKRNKVIKDNQKVWHDITVLLPRLLNLTSIFRIDYEVDSLKATAEFAKFAKYHDECESLTQFVDTMSPRIDKLMHIREEEE